MLARILRSRLSGSVSAGAAQRRSVSSLGEFANIQIDKLNGDNPHSVQNLRNGEWYSSFTTETIVDPLNGEPFLRLPKADVKELPDYIKSLNSCSKTGLHNPFRNVDRYLMLGKVSDKLSHALRIPEIADYFTRLIMRTSPKSYKQAYGEVAICAQFLDNFSGDSVRFLARSFGIPGDHDGQVSQGYRFPYGPVALITPFNFPLEIPVLQLMGALYMGNKPLLKVDSKVSVVMEQFLRLMHACGLPKTDVDFINSDGPTMHKLLLKAQPRMTLFTGSSRVAERLAKDLHGRIKIEDAGFDWKILGPDANPSGTDFDFVSYTCDQDAYACSGQKCSAQSMLFAHKNWVKAGIFDRMKELAGRRKLDDLTIGPVLTWTTEQIKAHVDALLTIKGAKLLFGGNELNNGKHSIPKCYGAIEPTAVFVPLRELRKPRTFGLATTEVFGPLQVVTEYKTSEIDKVIDCCERMTAHLTAAVVSKDEQFRHYVLGRTVNGTTYSGIRARTTGAPQNHWFGPSGDPRGAGIGTKEAIQLVWSSHREVIADIGPISKEWTLPQCT